MFSTVDQPRLRFVRVQITSEVGTEMAVIWDGAPAPERIRPLADRARALPTDTNLAALAKAVAEMRLQGAGSNLRYRADTGESGGVREGAHIPMAVDVEVYSLRYLRARGVLLKQTISRYRWADTRA